jgi:hypothetical protein
LHVLADVQDEICQHQEAQVSAIHDDYNRQLQELTRGFEQQVCEAAGPALFQSLRPEPLEACVNRLQANATPQSLPVSHLSAASVVLPWRHTHSCESLL